MRSKGDIMNECISEEHKSEEDWLHLVWARPPPPCTWPVCGSLHQPAKRLYEELDPPNSQSGKNKHFLEKCANLRCTKSVKVYFSFLLHSWAKGSNPVKKSAPV